MSYKKPNTESAHPFLQMLHEYRGEYVEACKVVSKLLNTHKFSMRGSYQYEYVAVPSIKLVGQRREVEKNLAEAEKSGASVKNLKKFEAFRVDLVGDRDWGIRIEDTGYLYIDEDTRRFLEKIPLVRKRRISSEFSGLSYDDILECKTSAIEAILAGDVLDVITRVLKSDLMEDGKLEEFNTKKEDFLANIKARSTETTPADKPTKSTPSGSFVAAGDEKSGEELHPWKQLGNAIRELRKNRRFVAGQVYTGDETKQLKKGGYGHGAVGQGRDFADKMALIKKHDPAQSYEGVPTTKRYVMAVEEGLILITEIAFNLFMKALQPTPEEQINLDGLFVAAEDSGPPEKGRVAKLLHQIVASGALTWAGIERLANTSQDLLALSKDGYVTEGMVEFIDRFADSGEVGGREEELKEAARADFRDKFGVSYEDHVSRKEQNKYPSINGLKELLNMLKEVEGLGVEGLGRTRQKLKSGSEIGRFIVACSDGRISFSEHMLIINFRNDGKYPGHKNRMPENMPIYLDILRRFLGDKVITKEVEKGLLESVRKDFDSEIDGKGAGGGKSRPSPSSPYAGATR